MTYQVCELVQQDGEWVQVTRDATPEESSEIDARRSAPAPVPEVISPRQFRQSLTHFGYRTSVEGAVTSADQDTKDWYAYAAQFERNHPKVLTMSQSLGYTSDQVDQVWRYGASI